MALEKGCTMKILNRYITLQVVGASLLTLIVLVALDVGYVLIQEMERHNEAYGWLQATTYTALTIPGRMYVLLPPAVLIGSLLSLGALAENSELTAMRAAGLSITQIVGHTLTAGMLLMLLAVFLGEGVAPPSERQAQQIRVTGISGQVQLGSEGLWARDGQRYIHVSRVLPDQHLRDVRVFVFADGLELREAVHIRDARYLGAQGWQMDGLSRSQIDFSGVRTERVAEEVWPRLIQPDLLDVIIVESRHMSALALWRYVGYLRANQLESEPYQLAFWSRITMPLSSLVMLLLATPFVFGLLRGGGAGQRLFVGILLGVGFNSLNMTLGHVGLASGLPPLLSATLPMLIFLALALWGLSRVR